MRAARIDRNHAEIVLALRGIGAEVTSLARMGTGVPDLLVSYRGRWFVIEIKDGTKPPSDRKLTDAQVKWHALQRAPVLVVKSVAEAVDALTAPTEWVLNIDSGWRKALGDALEGTA